ncbi:MAG: ATP-binding protein [Chitinophagales bacterium]|nr:ATP-binding protein [Chitinophagales bacterium]HMW95560.1 ATP-binding protein [Chitinophagales bacterium]HNB39829.1 ATP-binding protein [Chitinophagales bacterium]HNC65298.1 ATP-binding protein [Chitinophagales bacterium]HNG09612.1 ATP-binding protein [Chitinophagales bacterium]
MRNYIYRKEYVDKLLLYKDHDLIKVVTGLRRSGKSTLFRMYRDVLLEQGISKNQIVFLNFEDFELRKYQNDLEGLYRFIIKKVDFAQPCYIFLDEIQNINNFEQLVDGLYIRPNTDVYITGSNAYLLSGELATLLSGRYIEFSILPFSFKEYLTARRIDISNTYLNYESLFFDYINETSLPKGIELRTLGYDKIFEYLEAVYKTVVEKDITQRYQIYNRHTFLNVIKYVSTTIGTPLSPNNIATILRHNGEDIHNMTVSKYLDYLVNSFIFYRVHRFDIKGKKQLATMEKYYLVDIGFLNILVGKDRTTDRGYLLENIVYLELLRRGNKVWTGTTRNNEVDFVCKTPSGEIEYYQVSWKLSSVKTFNREFSALEKIKDNYPKFLLTTESFLETRSGIIHLNVFHWLMK